MIIKQESSPDENTATSKPITFDDVEEVLVCVHVSRSLQVRMRAESLLRQNSALICKVHDPIDYLFNSSVPAPQKTPSPLSRL
ncbi:hypothetical protein TNCV_2852231 [Trichonephila clavipes]|nr:hypothetical protein TNCV_2852231 [Trichonephila clavipes]